MVLAPLCAIISGDGSSGWLGELLSGLDAARQFGDPEELVKEDNRFPPSGMHVQVYMQQITLE